MRRRFGPGRTAKALTAACAAAWLAACGGSGGDAAPSGASADPAQASSPTGASVSGGSPSAATAAAGAPAAATAAQIASASAAGTASADSTVSATDKAFADQMLAAVNQVRATARSCGNTAYPAAGPLRWQAQTEQAARAQAEYLQQNNLFSHTGANGSTVGTRLTATGYVWSTVGENIAAGHGDIPGVVKGWVDSPGHCANLMNANFVDLGVVLVPGTSANTYRTYWGMVLAKPR